METNEVDADIVADAMQAVRGDDGIEVIGGTDCAVNIEVTDKAGNELKN